MLEVCCLATAHRAALTHYNISKFFQSGVIPVTNERELKRTQEACLANCMLVLEMKRIDVILSGTRLNYRGYLYSSQYIPNASAVARITRSK